MLPRHTIDYTPDYSPAQKIAILSVLIFALLLTGIAGSFVYEFIQTYHQWLSHALFYLCAVIGVAVVILIAAVTAYAIAMLMLHYESRRLDKSQQAQNLQTVQANNALFTATAEQISAGHVYLSEQRTELGIVKFKSLPKHAKQQPKIERLESVASPIAESTSKPEIKTTLLSDIEPMQRLLIVGGQNSGKTTLLKHIARQRNSAGNVLVLDSHNTLGKWSSDYRIVGHGRDYSAIETELKNLVAVMDNRYKELASGKVGERKHELITVICDEWTTVSKNLNNLDAYLLPLLTESRKVGIDLMLATHSQTAESLGLKGKADLKTAFDAVLILKNISGKRIVDLDNGESISNYHHCGAFIESSNKYKPELVNNEFQNKLNSILTNPIVKEDLIKEQLTIETYHELIKANSYTLSKLTKLVYGNSNGRNIRKVKKFLESRGIATT
jgi:hypothetical protein